MHAVSHEPYSSFLPDHERVRDRGLVTRMKRVGLHLPEESAWRPIMQAASVAGLDIGNSVKTVQQAKEMLHKKKDIMCTHLVSFPADPEDLPWFEEAYGDDLPKRLAETQAISTDVKLRKDKSSSKSSSSLVNPKAIDLDMGTSAEEEMRRLRMMFQMGMQMMWGVSANPSASGSAGPDWMNMGPPTKKAKALPPGPADQPDAAAAAAQPAIADCPSKAAEPTAAAAATTKEAEPSAPKHSVLLGTDGLEEPEDESPENSLKKPAAAAAKAKGGGKAVKKRPAASAAQASASGQPGKSIYGIERDRFKESFKGEDWESAWRLSRECQEVLAKMTHGERKKRRLDHLWRGK